MFGGIIANLIIQASYKVKPVNSKLKKVDPAGHGNRLKPPKNSLEL
jgi:hypothetical protein